CRRRLHSTVFAATNSVSGVSIAPMLSLRRGQVWLRSGSGLAPVWHRFGPGLAPVWLDACLNSPNRHESGLA
ncbi:MAG: hypothetical protein AAFQ44_12015, partial [Pseudomonadota bacterium]